MHCLKNLGADFQFMNNSLVFFMSLAFIFVCLFSDILSLTMLNPFLPCIKIESVS